MYEVIGLPDKYIFDLRPLKYNGILVPSVRTSFGWRRRGDKTYNVSMQGWWDMLNAIKSVLVDVSSVRPSSEQIIKTYKTKTPVTLVKSAYDTQFLITLLGNHFSFHLISLCCKRIVYLSSAEWSEA